MRSNEDIEQMVDLHGSTIWRTCAVYFRSKYDAQDAFQETVLKYALADNVAFKEEEHRKAWLIRVASNVCKDMLRSAQRSVLNLDDQFDQGRTSLIDQSDSPSSFSNDVVDAIRRLDDPPRTPLYLSLYEGYSAVEIAEMNDVPVNTVYSWLSRGKQKLKEALQ